MRKVINLFAIFFISIGSLKALAYEQVKISLTPKLTICNVDQNGTQCSVESSATYNETIELEPAGAEFKGQTLREFESRGMLFKYLLNIDKQDRPSGSRYVVQIVYFVSSGTQSIANDLLGYVIVSDSREINNVTLTGERIKVDSNTYVKPTVQIQSW